LSLYFTVRQQPYVITMSATHPLLILILGIAVVLAAGCTQPATDQQKTPAVTMTNLVSPCPPSDDVR
jgi:uncharacterized lipoprotein YajG